MATARNDEIEVRVDLDHASSRIEYRSLDLDNAKWMGTPFCRADVSFEEDALTLVSEWLEHA